mmetsp:Transcript_16933/g.59160  ORF Transcript_16933/g.59160 Transcript_16933/m.59160 type:complete len:279 (-) Transcript_16933:53-889(-)
MPQQHVGTLAAVHELVDPILQLGVVEDLELLQGLRRPGHARHQGLHVPRQNVLNDFREGLQVTLAELHEPQAPEGEQDHVVQLHQLRDLLPLRRRVLDLLDARREAQRHLRLDHGRQAAQILLRSMLEDVHQGDGRVATFAHVGELGQEEFLHSARTHLQHAACNRVGGAGRRRQRLLLRRVGGGHGGKAAAAAEPLANDSGAAAAEERRPHRSGDKLTTCKGHPAAAAQSGSQGGGRHSNGLAPHGCRATAPRSSAQSAPPPSATASAGGSSDGSAQ